MSNESENIDPATIPYLLNLDLNDVESLKLFKQSLFYYKIIENDKIISKTIGSDLEYIIFNHLEYYKIRAEISLTYKEDNPQLAYDNLMDYKHYKDVVDAITKGVYSGN
jgi:hypothetical protein